MEHMALLGIRHSPVADPALTAARAAAINACRRAYAHFYGDTFDALSRFGSPIASEPLAARRTFTRFYCERRQNRCEYTPRVML